MEGYFDMKVQYRVKIFPDIGDSYIVKIFVPTEVDDIDEFFDDWIFENLNFVDSYQVLPEKV